jgi:hypothetical protein
MWITRIHQAVTIDYDILCRLVANSAVALVPVHVLHLP